MAPFAPTLDHAQASAIRDYVIHRANAPDGPNAGKSVRQPDLNHGAAIVAQGTAAGAPACAQCHAFTGSSDASGAFPRLAGQPAPGFASAARRLLPISDWMSAYRREWVLPDVFAGVALWAVMVPEGHLGVGGRIVPC